MKAVINSLKAQSIPTYIPGDVEYERSVATSNRLFRFARPDVVVQPENATQVIAIVKEAKANGIPMTIKGGGHSYAGFSTTNTGISLDLAKMNKVKLDMDAKTVTVEAGALWAHVYKKLINGKYDGFIVNGGRCPTVGVSGFTLGGGLGPFGRSFGMGVDNLKEAKIITADGKRVHLRDTDDPESEKGKLFWALRGAGGGNFGVVVEYKFDILQLKDKLVTAGRYTWFPNNTKEALDELVSTMTKIYTTPWPNEMTLDSSWLCDLGIREPSRNIGVRFLAYYNGNQENFDATIKEHIKQPEVSKQLTRRALEEPSTRFLHETLVAQWSEETTKAFPTNNTYSLHCSFVFGNDLETMQALSKIIREELEVFKKLYEGEKVVAQVTFIHSGGKASEKAPTDTAFAWRQAVYHSYIMMEWEDKWMEKNMRGFMGILRTKLRPYSLRGEAAYINFTDTSIQKDSYERAYYGDNFEALQQIKESWDPDNYFDWEQGIRTGNVFAYDMKEEGEEDGPAVAAYVPDDEALTDSIAARQWDTFASSLTGDSIIWKGLDQFGRLVL